jgi:uncharacterized membrane protein
MPADSEEQFQSTTAIIQRSLKARADAKRSFAERLADQMTVHFGSMIFLIVNTLWFLVWIVINLGLVPGLPVFDPFPFGLLTMIVSLEAIILAIVVLISQNRAARIANVREEIALQVEEISEQEITMLLRLMVKLLEKQGVDLSQDQEVQTMLLPTDTENLTQTLEELENLENNV